MIDPQRMAGVFTMLVETDSVSREEGAVSAILQKMLKDLGGTLSMDNAGEKVGGQTGNLVAKFPGNREAEPLMLNAHMDTVEPGRGIKAVLKDGVFTSAGDTILGADDKSAIAIILEVLQVIKENDLPHGPIEVLFTICEEIGLQGAKNLDFSLLTAKYGYALDTQDTEGIVTRAPAANKLEFRVYGKEAHAGATPELGINAIFAAAKAVSRLKIGRIDNETTCNLGLVKGGMATNIVPNLVTINGEARSRDEGKLAAITEELVSGFENAMAELRKEIGDPELPRVEADVVHDFKRTHIPDDHYVVQLAREAAANLGMKMETKTTGGGADANVFFEKGIITGVIGTGMQNMHSKEESVALDDMVKTAKLVLELVDLHTQKGGPAK